MQSKHLLSMVTVALDNFKWSFDGRLFGCRTLPFTLPFTVITLTGPSGVSFALGKLIIGWSFDLGGDGLIELNGFRLLLAKWFRFTFVLTAGLATRLVSIVSSLWLLKLWLLFRLWWALKSWWLWLRFNESKLSNAVGMRLCRFSIFSSSLNVLPLRAKPLKSGARSFSVLWWWLPVEIVRLILRIVLDDELVNTFRTTFGWWLPFRFAEWLIGCSLIRFPVCTLHVKVK